MPVAPGFLSMLNDGASIRHSLRTVLILLCTCGLPAIGAAEGPGEAQPAAVGRRPGNGVLLAQNTASTDPASRDSLDEPVGVSGRTPAAEMSADEIARELSNPVTALASVYLDFEYRTFAGSLPGSSDKISKVYRLVPSVPIPLSNGNNILLRATIPMVMEKPLWELHHDDPHWEVDLDYADFLVRQSSYVTPSSGQFGHEHGHLDDTTLEVAYGGVGEHGFISMYGLAAVFPSSQDQSASRNQFLLGPELAFGKVTARGLAGVVLKHLARVSGEDRFDTNETTAKVFFAYGLGGGWQVFSNPTILYDWEADGGNKWLLPLGGGISRTLRIGGVPIKLAIEAQKFVVSPDRLGPEWSVNFSLMPVFKNPFFD
jgi:hypothetical protein